jgi:hypothetical protein
MVGAGGETRSYDLYVQSGPSRVSWRLSDHGVTLAPDRIAWVSDRKGRDALYSNIVEVRLQLNRIGHATTPACRIRFSDGTLLAVRGCSNSGGADARQAALYADFARDLHGRLAARMDSIDFTAGFSKARYRLGRALVVMAALFFIVFPTVILLLTGALQLVFGLYLGVFLAWPLHKLVKANAPRSYDPAHLPEELVPAPPDARPTAPST